MTYLQYAGRHGLVTDYDVQAHIHGGLMAAHMPKSYHVRYRKKLEFLQEERERGQRQYKEAIDSGEIAPTAELSSIERMRIKAQGHDDLPSVQAARRVLKKMEDRQKELDELP